MDRTTAAILVVAAGAAVGAQAPINGALGRHVGTCQAAFVNFAVGLAILTRDRRRRRRRVRRPARDPRARRGGRCSGGACGVAVVSAVDRRRRSLGAGGVTAAVVAGQLTASVVIDRFGLFGVDAPAAHGRRSSSASRCSRSAST